MFSEMGKLISSGHYGAIYQSNKDKDKCIKIIHFELEDGRTTEDMYKEYKKIQKLNYKHFIKIYSLKYDGYFLFIEMEKI